MARKTLTEGYVSLRMFIYSKNSRYIDENLPKDHFSFLKRVCLGYKREPGRFSSLVIRITY